MNSIIEAVKKGLKLKRDKASKEEKKVRKWVKKQLPKLIAASEYSNAVEVDEVELCKDWEVICKVLFEVEGVKRVERYKVSGHNFLGWELEYKVVRIEFEVK